MNGFANSLLSILLSWIRALVSNIWTMINSENGGAVYLFFADNWLMLLGILLVFGFVTDRIVYLFRWRPYYVWLSRLDRIRQRSQNAKQSRLMADESHGPVPEIAPGPMQFDSVPTVAYAPLKRGYAASAEIYHQTCMPEEPVFDEPVADWNTPAEWQAEIPVEHKRPRSNTIDYYQDVQAGFAPAIPPEQLYAPPRSSEAQASQVHPGLDDESFRQNFGLQEEVHQPAPVMRAPAFRPFTAREVEAPVRPERALSRFARRARDLVGVDDDEQRYSIRDLQNTVDVSKAFHEPVYPQSMKIDE